MNLSEFIEYVKEAQGELSQKEFAGRMGISPQYLNDVLTGKREPGEGILRPMGVTKKVSYEKEEPYAVEVPEHQDILVTRTGENHTTRVTHTGNLQNRGVAEKRVMPNSRRATDTSVGLAATPEATVKRAGASPASPTNTAKELRVEKDEYSQE